MRNGWLSLEKICPLTDEKLIANGEFEFGATRLPRNQNLE